MFDTSRFLADKFRDADGIVGLFGAYRIPCPPKDTVRKWFERQSVPGEWLVMLLAVVELDEGQPVRLSPYILSGKGRNAD